MGATLTLSLVVPFWTHLGIDVPYKAFAGIYVVLIFIFMLFRFKETKFEQAVIAIFASACIPYSFSLMIVFRDIDEHIEGYTSIEGIYFLIFAFFCAWMTDTFAYFVGSKLGKHKLCPNISPKKSVEGAIGGVVGAILLNVLLLFIFKRFFFESDSQLSYITVIFLSLILSVISMFGDLAASTIKRNFGIKDFGKLLPGHGGIMDRFDSALFVMPVLYSVISLINNF
jgi:phosphatidate cytidylyltransferase